MRILISIAAVLLAGCGSAVGDRDSSATPPYDGPLEAGAAVAALECDGRTPYHRFDGEYGDGLATVQDSAEKALDNYMAEAGLGSWTPSDGYAVERERPGRKLISYDVDGRTKVSIVAADDVRDWSGERGWGIRAWAQCDPSELPGEITDDLNIGVWEDESGRRVPITRIQSFQGADHCSWTHITFLHVRREGKRRRPQYVRDVDGELGEFLRGTFANRASLPPGATDTGWSRNGEQLWIAPDWDAAYLVNLDDPDDIERWPAAKRRIGCA